MSAPLDGTQLVGLIGILAAIIGASLSAGTHYLFDRKREKGKRVAEVATEQLELYSAFLYNLRILKAAMDTYLLPRLDEKQERLSDQESNKQSSYQRIKEVANKIDQLLQNKTHLLNPGLWGTWSVVREHFEVPLLFELDLHSTYLAVNELTIDLDNRFSEIISKYETDVVKLGYVKPKEDPYYKKYYETRSKISRKSEQWLAGRILAMRQEAKNSENEPSTSNETKPEDEKKGENSAG